VGDDAAADVGGGHAVGAKTVLVRTGKFTPQALAAAAVQPDAILDSVADLPDALRVMR
jgi:phospholysine phosphohistidine inorganic pyrophosphate phosphatase